MPLNGILSANKVEKFFSDIPDSRRIFFKQTMIIQIVLTVLLFGAMAINQDPISIIGLGFAYDWRLILSLLLLCFLGTWVIQIYIKRRNEASIVREIERDTAVLFLYPRTKVEYHWSLGVSLTVGICEEIIFRGFLYWQLAEWLPIIPAILLTNVIFGLVHYATGFRNASLAFVLGVLLSVIFIYTSSLWLPILIHILVDVYAMTRGKRYFDLKSNVYDEAGARGRNHVMRIDKDID